MPQFTSKDRQRIIDGYLASTRRNMFHAGEFIDWLGGNPDHEAYPWFYAKDDAEAAREYRIGLARQMASGLRITSNVQASEAKPVNVRVREYPAMVSPIAGRKSGGGYEPFHPDDPAMVAELRRQGAQALRSWLARYRGVMENGGTDVGPIEEIAAQIEGGVADAA